MMAKLLTIATCCLLACATFTQATQTLTLTRPKNWADKMVPQTDAAVNWNFKDPDTPTPIPPPTGPNGITYTEPSLFGLPNYQADLLGQVKLPLNATGGDNVNGCAPYDPQWNPFNGDNKPSNVYIALVKRGGCSFGTKAMAAQTAGAAAIVVYDDQADSRIPLPKMAAGDLTPSINIPGMFILRTAGEDLLSLLAKEDDTDKTSVWVALRYSIIAPDDRVEYDYFTYPDEPTAQQFVKDFIDVVPSIAEKTLFTPHYRLIEGAARQCDYTPPPGEPCTDDDLQCGSQCSHCGRYCYVDPDKNLDTRPTGIDFVREVARGKCVWSHARNINNAQLWWQYSSQRENDLDCIHAVPYDDACSLTAMANVGLSQGEIDWVEGCTGFSGGQAPTGTDYLNNTNNGILDDEITWMYDWQPLTSPYLYVNGFAYFGKFGCPAPATTSTCGPLSIICAGFPAGSAPDACTAGLDTSASKFPIGPVIGVAIVCCIVIAGAVWYYMRRQNTKMRDDIDSLLKQYLPLEGQNGSSKTQGNGQMRLIGNIDTSDEPTDL